MVLSTINIIATLVLGLTILWFIFDAIKSFNVFMEEADSANHQSDQKLDACLRKLDSINAFLAEFEKKKEETSSGGKNDWDKIRKAFRHQDVNGRS